MSSIIAKGANREVYIKRTRRALRRRCGRCVTDEALGRLDCSMCGAMLNGSVLVRVSAKRPDGVGERGVVFASENPLQTKEFSAIKSLTAEFRGRPKKSAREKQQTKANYQREYMRKRREG